MAAIEAMITETHGWLMESRAAHRTRRDDSFNACLAATRLNALLDCYAAIGGNTAKWRKPDSRALR